MSDDNAMAVVAKKVVEIVENDIKSKGPSPYDTTATVTRIEDGTIYVHIPGGVPETPARLSVDAEEGDTVQLRVSGGSAWLTGNVSKPPASWLTIFQNLKNPKNMNRLIEGSVLSAPVGFFNDLYAKNVTAENLYATNGYVQHLVAEDITAESITADHARIGELESDKANIRLANIDTANISVAKIGDLFAAVGMVQDMHISEGHVTGNLSSVSIDGDVINVNHLKANSLTLLGNDGLYYALNVNSLGEAVVQDLTPEEQDKLKDGIHGSNLIAHTVTANKIYVDDISAFGAKISDFIINQTYSYILTSDTEIDPQKIYYTRSGTDPNYIYTFVDKPDPENLSTYYERRYGSGAIYSVGKSSVDSPTDGIYMDSTGQMTIGGYDNFITYFRDTQDSNKWKLAISADQISMGDIGSIHDIIKSDVKLEVRYTIDSQAATLWHFTAYLYRGETDVKREYDPTYFTWCYKTEADGGALHPILDGNDQPVTGYTCDVQIGDLAGLDQTLVCTFEPTANDGLLASTGDTLATNDYTPITARAVEATGDSVRISDLARTNTANPTDEVLIVTPNDEKLISVKKIADAVDKHFAYTQATASAEWVIQHNLNKFPGVKILDNFGEEIVGNVVYTTPNIARVTFSKPYSGVAYCN